MLKSFNLILSFTFLLALSMTSLLAFQSDSDEDISAPLKKPKTKETYDEIFAIIQEAIQSKEYCIDQDEIACSEDDKPLEILPSSIGRLTNQVDLNLTGNLFEELPASLGNLTNLKSLSLSDNRLTDPSHVVENLTQLIYLNIADNKLTSLAFIGKLPALETLYLGNNQISVIPDSISTLTNLNELDLSGNKIKKIPDSLTNLTNLKYLDLSENEIIEVPEFLKNMTNLRSLELDSQNIPTDKQVDLNNNAEE